MDLPFKVLPHVVVMTEAVAGEVEVIGAEVLVMVHPVTPEVGGLVIIFLMLSLIVI
jgi:hypothetical protein